MHKEWPVAFYGLDTTDLLYRGLAEMERLM